jgi:hypothetical protein
MLISELNGIESDPLDYSDKNLIGNYNKILAEEIKKANLENMDSSKLSEIKKKANDIFELRKKWFDLWGEKLQLSDFRNIEYLHKRFGKTKSLEYLKNIAEIMDKSNSELLNDKKLIGLLSISGKPVVFNEEITEKYRKTILQKLVEKDKENIENEKSNKSRILPQLNPYQLALDVALNMNAEDTDLRMRAAIIDRDAEKARELHRQFTYLELTRAGVDMVGDPMIGTAIGGIPGAAFGFAYSMTKGSITISKIVRQRNLLQKLEAELKQEVKDAEARARAEQERRDREYRVLIQSQGGANARDVDEGSIDRTSRTC